VLNSRVSCLSLAAVLVLPAAAVAQGNGVPQRGDHASVIERLEALEAAVALLETDQQSLRNQATSLEGGLASLESDVQAIKDRPVMALNPYLGAIPDQRGPLVRLTGVNLQIVNGTNATSQINSLGNLVVGYDETAPEASGIWCSDWDNPPPFGQPCIAVKTGSHDIVVGSYDSYMSYGGFVAGTLNTAWDPFCSVTAGAYSWAEGQAGYGGASVSGGEHNRAADFDSSVSGGAGNKIVDGGSISGGHRNSVREGGSVSGGELNATRGSSSAPDCESITSGYTNYVGSQEGWCGSVSGGAFNLAGGSYSSISGGERNRTTGPDNDGYGDYSTITAGDHNMAWSFHSSISGGTGNATGARYDGSAITSAITGGYHNSTVGAYSSISGGKDRTATGDYNWVAGSLLEPY
jgi:hypothetical protein